MLKYLIFLSLPLSAQMRLTYTPEPMQVLKPYGVSSVGRYRIDACSSAAVDQILRPQQARQLVAAQVTLLDLDSARSIIEDNAGKTKTARTVEIAGYVLLGIPALGGTKWISAHPQWVQGISTGTGIAMQFQSVLRGKIRDLSKLYEKDFSGPIQIKAHDCETRTMFSAKMPKPPKIDKAIGGPSEVTNDRSNEEVH